MVRARHKATSPCGHNQEQWSRLVLVGACGILRKDNGGHHKMAAVGGGGSHITWGGFTKWQEVPGQASFCEGDSQVQMRSPCKASWVPAKPALWQKARFGFLLIHLFRIFICHVYHQRDTKQVITIKTQYNKYTSERNNPIYWAGSEPRILPGHFVHTPQKEATDQQPFD